MEKLQEREREELRVVAELLKLLAHPVRLCIVKNLAKNGECNVSRMQQCVEAPQSTISQHLAKLRSGGIIEGKRVGVEVYYTLTNPVVERIVRLLL